MSAKRIKLVMFYQGVPFEGSTLKSFTPDAEYSDATLRRGLEASIEDKGVRIQSAKDDVLVPWNNVGSVKFYMEEKKQASKSKS